MEKLEIIETQPNSDLALHHPKDPQHIDSSSGQGTQIPTCPKWCPEKDATGKPARML